MSDTPALSPMRAELRETLRLAAPLALSPLARAAQLLLEAGALSVDVAVTHALFVGDALAQLRAAGVRHVWSSDAVPHATAVVGTSGLLAAAVRAFWADGGR